MMIPVMEERRQLGLLELPLVVGKLWDSDSRFRTI